MTTPQTLTYRQAARHLLQQAQDELAAGDLRQASEKAWLATAQIIKAHAQHRGWPHHAHWHLNQALSNLVRETNDNTIRDLFNAAQSLHTNAYEMWLPTDAIQDNLQRVQQLIPILDSLLP